MADWEYEGEPGTHEAEPGVDEGPGFFRTTPAGSRRGGDVARASLQGGPRRGNEGVAGRRGLPGHDGDASRGHRASDAEADCMGILRRTTTEECRFDLRARFWQD